MTMARIDLADQLGGARARVAAETPPEKRAIAKFARLTRKDTRIRADQDAALTALARTLMRQRARKVERITENTLIRIAIDLLLAHADDLRGSTEEELRKSMASEAPDSRTSEVRDSVTRELMDSGRPANPQSGRSVPRHFPTFEPTDPGSSAPAGPASPRPRPAGPEGGGALTGDRTSSASSRVEVRR